MLKNEFFARKKISGTIYLLRTTKLHFIKKNIIFLQWSLNDNLVNVRTYVIWYLIEVGIFTVITNNLL